MVVNTLLWSSSRACCRLKPKLPGHKTSCMVFYEDDEASETVLLLCTWAHQSAHHWIQPYVCG